MYEKALCVVSRLTIKKEISTLLDCTFQSKAGIHCVISRRLYDSHEEMSTNTVRRLRCMTVTHNLCAQTARVDGCAQIECSQSTSKVGEGL